MNTSSQRDTKRPTSVAIGPNSYKELLVSRRGERVLLVQFNRPTVRNALNRRAYYELIRILRTVAHDPTLTIIVFTGVGDAFSAGNDLTETAAAMRALSGDSNEMDRKRLQLNRSANFVLRSLVHAFIYCPKILVALVNGVSIGMGFTLAALCDIVYCTENAYFEAPFTRLGLCPEMCSSFLFPRILGRSKATEVLTLGARMTADEALQFRFVAGIFKTEELETHFWPKILKYSLLPAGSLETSKRLITERMREALLKAFAAEINVLEQSRLGPVHVSALRKFLEKRKSNKSLRYVASKYEKTFIIIAPLMKFGGEAILHLISETNPNSTRIVWISTHLKDMEMLRVQLPSQQRVRLKCYGCEINSATAIHMAIVYLAKLLHKVDAVIHLVPQWDHDENSKRFRPLLCANGVSVEIFRSGIKEYFGSNVKYVTLEHSTSADPFDIANQVYKIAHS